MEELIKNLVRFAKLAYENGKDNNSLVAEILAQYNDYLFKRKINQVKSMMNLNYTN